ncbi:unnamed protein product [Closterium sp. NIES-64]|nr:unnamed protein product [Closterium sp. NIES-64]
MLCSRNCMTQNKWKNRKEVRGVGFGRERAGRGEVATGQLDVLEKAVRILHLRYRSCLRPLTPPFTCSSPTPLNPMPLPLLTCIPLTCVTHTPLPPHPHPTPPPLPSHAYPPTRAENGRGGGRSQLDSVELDVLEKAVRILHLRYRSCLRPLTKGRLPSVTELRELRVSAEALGVRSALLCLDRIPKGRLPSVTELRELRVSAEALGVRSALLCLDRIPKSTFEAPQKRSTLLCLDRMPKVGGRPSMHCTVHSTEALGAEGALRRWGATPVASPSLPSAHSPCAPSWTRRPLPPFPTAPHLPPLLPHPPSGRSPPTGSLCLPHIRPARRAGRGGPALAPNTPLLPPRPPPPLRPPSPGRPPSSRPLCLPHIRPARRAGRGGPSLPSPPLPTFPHSSPTPPPLLPHSSPTPPQGDPRRLALFAFRTFALRAELDAEALRDLDEPPPGNAWPVSSYRVGTPRLRALLEDMVEEVESLWNATNRTLYEVAIVLAPVLAQYALLGKAVGMAMEQYYARLTVRKHGRVVMAVGDEIILWDDGLEDVRELFLAEKAADEQPLGSAVRIDSMNDYSWFVSWNGTSAVDNIPSEVSVKKLLHSIGAPTARLAGLRARDKGLLMGVTVPDVRIEAEKRVLAQLQWVVDGGGKLEIKAARPQHQGISAGVGEREVIGRGKRAAGGGTGAAAGGGMDEPEPAHEIPYEDLVEATKNWSDDLQLGEGGSAPEPAHEIPYEDLVEATKNWSDDLQLGEGGSAVVYKGVSPDGELWAVKRGKKGGLTRLQDYHREVREWVLMGGAEIREDECGCVQGRGAGWGAELWAVKRGKKGGLTRLQDYHREGVGPDGEAWAVKRGKKGGLTQLQDYHRGIEAVSKMLHPNLVRLMGFCHENEEQVLVYEYVANGTLRQHLSPLQDNIYPRYKEQVLVYEYVANGTLRQHLSPLQGDTEKGLLSFEQRIEEAVGVAEALLYLHSCKPVLPALPFPSRSPTPGDTEKGVLSFEQRIEAAVGVAEALLYLHSCKPVLVHRDMLLSLRPCDTEKGVLSFEQRIEAAVGVAEALLYLHSCKPVLVHRDVKSLNVFMDDDLQRKLGTKPKLGDYGNLKSIGDDESATTHTRVVGTPGYLDPQYCQTSVVSVWSDVYSFGVVMLELITAKPPVLKEADDSGERMALAKWATPAICAGNLDAVVDPNLAQAFPQQPMQAFASLAAMCVQRQPKDRPSMQEVVRRLKVIRQAAAAASVSSPPPINTRPNPSMQRILPPKPGSRGSWRDNQHLTPPMSPLLPTTPEPSYSPRAAAAGGGGSGGMKVFNKEFWRPRRAPARSLRGAGGSVPVAAQAESSRGRMYGLGRKGKMVSAAALISVGGNHTNLAAILGYAADKEDMQIALILVPPSPPPAFYSLSPFALTACLLFLSLQQKEMAALAKLQHTNLAAILGYAADKEDMQIAYDLPPNCTCLENYLFPGMLREYSPLGSDLIIYDKEDMQIAYDLPPNCTCLENYLFPEDAEGEFLPLRVRLKVAVGIAKGLTFLVRLKVAVGIAKGLTFLHSSAVVHGNLLSRNIMLDKNFTVLLTGYGLATMLSKTSTRKNLKGPDGMAKDAFDYGVVLFELLTGRRGALVADREGADGLIAWAEPRIEEYELSAACAEPTKRMVVRMLDVLAKECVQEDPRCRPTMKDLVVRLYKPRIEEYELSTACAEPTKRMVVRMLDVLAKECVQEDPRCRPTMNDLVVRLYSLQESLASQ